MTPAPAVVLRLVSGSVGRLALLGRDSGGVIMVQASLSIAIPVNYLMAAGYKNLELQSIDLEISAQDVVYFDPSQERRINGLAELTTFYESLRNQIRVTIVFERHRTPP